MKTYKNHYKECRENYASDVSIYDLTYKVNSVKFDNENFNKMKKKIKHKLNYRMGCVDVTWATYLNDWREIKEISIFLDEVIPQIEKNVMGCFAKAEFVHIYENKKNVTKESSWAWHYDDCPAEFIKFAVYLNNVDETNGAMQIVPEIIESYRTSPNSIKGYPPQVFPKSRVPLEYIEGKEKITLIGQPGTNFVFTPNLIHRGTIPQQNSTNRMAMFVFLRPSLKKITNYANSASSYLPKRNAKAYELN